MLTQPRSNSPGMPLRLPLALCARIAYDLRKCARRCTIATIPRDAFPIKIPN